MPGLMAAETEVSDRFGSTVSISGLADSSVLRFGYMEHFNFISFIDLIDRTWDIELLDLILLALITHSVLRFEHNINIHRSTEGLNI